MKSNWEGHKKDTFYFLANHSGNKLEDYRQTRVGEIRLTFLQRSSQESRLTVLCNMCDSTCDSTHFNNHAIIPEPAENLYTVVTMCSLRPRPQRLVYRDGCT
jgi:hypothetical protein